MKQQFPQVNTSRGAPLGRRTSQLGCGPRSIKLFKVRLDSGGYDEGGAYWGHRLYGQDLYCAQCDEGGQEFVDATNRTQAAFKLDIENPSLKRRLPGAGLHYGLALLDGRTPMPEGKYRSDVIAWMESSGLAYFGGPTKEKS